MSFKQMHTFIHYDLNQGIQKSVIQKCSFVLLSSDSLYQLQATIELSIPKDYLCLF